MIMVLLSATFVTAAVLVIWPRPETLLCCRLGLIDFTPVRVSGKVMAGGVSALTACVAVVAFGDQFSHVVVAATGGGAAWAGWYFHRQRRERNTRDLWRAEVAEAIDALTSELESGVIASRALRSIARDWPFFASAASASQLGGDVAEALRIAARQPGAEALNRLAAAWQISDRAGSSQADILDKIGESLRDERDLAREIAAGLAPSRATARLLAALPALGLLLGSGVRGDSLHVLVGTTIGALCLAAGVVLAIVGIGWVEHLATNAEQW